MKEAASRPLGMALEHYGLSPGIPRCSAAAIVFCSAMEPSYCKCRVHRLLFARTLSFVEGRPCRHLHSRGSRGQGEESGAAASPLVGSRCHERDFQNFRAGLGHGAFAGGQSKVKFPRRVRYGKCL